MGDMGWVNVDRWWAKVSFVVFHFLPTMKYSRAFFQFLYLKKKLQEKEEREKSFLDLTKGLINGTQPFSQVRVWLVGMVKFHCPFVWEEKDLPLTKSQWNSPTYDEKFQLVERSRAKKLDNLGDGLFG